MRALSAIASDYEKDWDAGDLVLHYMKQVFRSREEVEQSSALTAPLKELGLKQISGASGLMDEMLKGVTFGQMIEAMNERGIATNLRIVAEVLKANGFKPPYSPHKAEEHAAILTEIMDDLRKSELDDTFRLELMRKVRDLRQIFQKYSELGFQNSDSLSKDILATVVLNNKSFEEADEEGKKAIQKLRTFLSENYTPLKYAIDAGLISTQVGLLLLGG